MSYSSGSQKMSEFYEMLFQYGSYICHQNIERSYAAFGVQFFLCARCTGIYAMMFLTLSGLPLVKSEKECVYKYILSLVVSIFLNAFAWMMGVDGNLSRTLLGALIGLSLGLLIYKSISILKEDKNEKNFR